jgi:hypothetical protein
MSRRWLAAAGGAMVAAALTPAALTPATAGASTRAATASVGLYWTDQQTGSVNVANLNGTGAVNLYTGAGHGNDAWGIAVNSSNLYWTTYGGGTIQEDPLTGGQDPQTFNIPADYPAGIALNSSHLYWGDPIGQKVGEANLDGSHAHLIVRYNFSDVPYAVAVDKTNLYWANNYAGPNGGEIEMGNLNAKGATVIDTGQYPVAITVADGHLFWLNNSRRPNEGSIDEANLNGTDVTPIPIASRYLPNPAGLAVYDGYVYWTNTTTFTSAGGTGPGDIVRVSLTGGTPQVVVSSDSNGPTGLAIGPR